MTWQAHDNAVSHFIASSNTESLELHVRAYADQPSRQPVLFVHGATYASRLYDIPHPGASWLKATADAGFAAYALDIRGYGRSHMTTTANDGRPFASAQDAIVDIRDVCDWIRQRHRSQSIALVGGSWGSMTASLFASLKPTNTPSALVLYAPIYAARNEGWLAFLADPAHPGQINPEFAQTRLVSEAETRIRWDAELPDGAEWREEAVFQALVQSSLADDPNAFTRDPPSFEVPNGTLSDLWEAFNGRALYNPGKITCPVLLIRGGMDATSTRSDALSLFDRIASPTKRYVEIANGAHFVSAEKRANEVFSVTSSFLKEFAGLCRETE